MLAEVLQPVSVVIASIAAVFSLWSWRSESLGRRRIELAEDALVAVHQTREAIHSARRQIGFSSEGRSRQRSEHEPEELQRALDSLFVPVERLETNSEIFAKVAVLRYRLHAYFGKQALDPMTEILRIRDEIIRACWLLMELARQGAGRPNIDDTYMKFYRIAVHSPDHDEVQDRLERSIEALEKVTRPVLSRRYWRR